MTPTAPPSPAWDNWKTQVRKGYLELCLLSVLRARGRLCGVDLLGILTEVGLETGEGTLYPLLNRLSAEGWLEAQWETPSGRGHPKKYYRLTPSGRSLAESMAREFRRMFDSFKLAGEKTGEKTE